MDIPSIVPPVTCFDTMTGCPTAPIRVQDLCVPRKKEDHLILPELIAQVPFSRSGRQLG